MKCSEINFVLCCHFWNVHPTCSRSSSNKHYSTTHSARIRIIYNEYKLQSRNNPPMQLEQSSYLNSLFINTITNFYRGQRIYRLPSGSRLALGPNQPPIKWVPGSISKGKVWPRYDGYHSSLSSAKVKNE